MGKNKFIEIDTREFWDYSFDNSWKSFLEGSFNTALPFMLGVWTVTKNKWVLFLVLLPLLITLRIDRKNKNGKK